MKIQTTPSTRRRPGLRTVGALAGGAVALLALAACSSTAVANSATPSATAQTGQGGNQQGRSGVSGLIAYAQDDLLQVQGDSEQTAVRYTADTTIRKTTTVDASAIAVGDCIVAVTAQDAHTATTITVTAAGDDGSCAAGFGGQGGGGQEGGMPTDAPTGGPGGGMPSGAPSGAPDGVAPTGGPGQGGFGQFTTGAVTAVSGSTLTVKTAGQDGATGSADVAVGSDTTVTTTVDAATSDIAVGLCVTAAGSADDKGGYDATSLTLSDPDSDGNCSTGFGGMGGRPGGQGEESGSDG